MADDDQGPYHSTTCCNLIFKMPMCHLRGKEMVHVKRSTFFKRISLKLDFLQTFWKSNVVIFYFFDSSGLWLYTRTSKKE